MQLPMGCKGIGEEVCVLAVYL